jgi:transposase-like protein
MELSKQAAKWLEHLQTWQQSGATQAAYCQKNGLHQKTFSNWKRQLREHLPGLPKLTRSLIVPPNPVAPLVAVNLTDDLVDTTSQPAKRLEHEIRAATCAGTSSGISLSVGGKYQISVATDFDSAVLNRLLAVLAKAP